MKRISIKERAYVKEVLDSQFRASAGSVMTKRLESKFAETFNSKFAISFVNGTATMHAALAAAKIGPGDEVIVPPLTMASTTMAVLHAGATPVFADVDPLTWTIDPKSISKLITRRTKAIIPVALYGLPADMDSIMKLARKHHLFVLEDDAQCFLGSYKNKIVGSIGQASSFSFQSSKQMTSGEGGMITTNDEDLANRIRRFNSLGYGAVSAGAGKGKITKDVIQDPNYSRHVSIGFNYRLPELCAAVALGQLERLKELVGQRVKIAQMYEKARDNCPWLTPQSVPAGYKHSYWTYVCKLETDKIDFTWYDFRKKYMELNGDGIYAAWQLTYLEPAFRNKNLTDKQTQKYDRGLCPVAENLQPKLLQFKTNYMDLSVAKKKAEALAKTIRYFSA